MGLITTKITVIIDRDNLILRSLDIVLEKAFKFMVTRVIRRDINLLIILITVVIAIINFVELTFPNYLFVIIKNTTFNQAKVY